ncbi:hypothetical protein A2803_02950 [Candidatus Woesebacteria bacterium RIFCSPHIGHO2_01_FULL_44_21]|uniref:Uncharacterized protein n=1 Tax=Candidatus Woesebacteria bacterium RIFCSPHIGHO2_01_FULL_44_21 TaxID=1802503 RepID=A0A1F7Z0P5_9BACT|nr:MAG: hypothetical protein A2803_02950 [Candidatus Woesebacteria bacterium RIFCSPHIGHO2_01_FULL_44_21]OGM69227.1 MAG: hypothetical protein A2897_04430 [Candidatus Woesebacteria bacterium RIFCSPLOWO2_01_FULL_44_24b]
MSAESNIIKLGITASLLFAADSAVNTSSVNAASLKDLSADAQEQGAIPTETPLGSSERQTLLFNVLTPNETLLQSVNIQGNRISRQDIENVVGAGAFISPVLDASINLAVQGGYDPSSLDQGVDVVSTQTGTYLIPNIRVNETKSLLIPYDVDGRAGVVPFEDRGENYSVSFLILTPAEDSDAQVEALPVEMYTNSEGRQIPVSMMEFQQNPDTGELTFIQTPIRVGQVDTNEINVRDVANQQVVARLPRGTEVYVIGEDADAVPSITSEAPNARFARIFYDGKIALASEDLLVITPTPVPEVQQGVEVAMVPEAAPLFSPEIAITLENEDREAITIDARADESIPGLTMAPVDPETFRVNLNNEKFDITPSENIIVEYRDVDTFEGEPDLTNSRLTYLSDGIPYEIHGSPEIQPDGRRILPIYIQMPQVYDGAMRSNSFQCPGEPYDLFSSQLYNRMLVALYLDKFPSQGNTGINIVSVVYRATSVPQLVHSTEDCSQLIEWPIPPEAVLFQYNPPTQ